jgi:hypothetical protein
MTVGALPRSPDSSLDQPFTTAVDDNFIDKQGWWSVDLSSTDLLAYLRDHRPAGFGASGSGGSSAPGLASTSTEMFTPTAGGSGRPRLLLTVVANGQRGSWLRADGQDTWYPPRPASETAPTDGTATIAVSGDPSRVVSDPVVVRRLADEFNSLIRSTPGTVAGPACAAGGRTLTIAFTRRGISRPALTASATPCSDFISVRGPDSALPALDGGDDLVDVALRQLGLSRSALLPPRPRGR